MCALSLLIRCFELQVSKHPIAEEPEPEQKSKVLPLSLSSFWLVPETAWGCFEGFVSTWCFLWPSVRALSVSCLCVHDVQVLSDKEKILEIERRLVFDDTRKSNALWIKPETCGSFLCCLLAVSL